MNNKYRNILILIYGIAIILLFFFLVIEPFVIKDGLEVNTSKTLLTAVTFQMGVLTAYLFNKGGGNGKH